MPGNHWTEGILCFETDLVEADEQLRVAGISFSVQEGRDED